MIWLIPALITSTLIMVCFRMFPKYHINILQAIAANYLTALLAGIATAVPQNTSVIFDAGWIPLGLTSGVLLIAVFFVFAQSAAKAGIAITSVSSKMSVLIPVSMGFIIFGEQLNAVRLIGIALALLAFWLTLRTHDGKKPSGLFILLPLLLFLGNGTNDTVLKAAQFEYLSNDQDLVLYLTFAFAVAFLIGLVAVVISMFRDKRKIKFRNIIAGVMLGLLNWYSTLFFLKGLSVTDVSVFVPLFNVSIVILGSIAGVLLFREKLGAKNLFGIFLAVIAIILISLGHD